MKKVSLAPRGMQPFEQWAEHMIKKLADASKENVFDIVDGLTIDGAFTETRTLTPSTATLGDLLNFVATLIDDLQKRGPNRVE